MPLKVGVNIRYKKKIGKAKKKWDFFFDLRKKKEKSGGIFFFDLRKKFAIKSGGKDSI